MHCPDCKKTNDTDAHFCTACGKSVQVLQQAVAEQRKAYFIALLFIPVIMLAAGIGYYKFFLPEGVVAVVNGEEIKRSELDAAVARALERQGAASGQLRCQLLSQLISQRIVLQEARKAGISVTMDEIETSVTEERISSDRDDAAFSKEVDSRYGSLRKFEEALERRLLVNKFLAVKVVPPGADPLTARSAISQWLEDITGKASIRIALEEQGGGPGCAGCNSENGHEPWKLSMSRRGCVAANRADALDAGKAAANASIRYWYAKHGPDTVTAKFTDFGCHIQVDIMKNEKVIGYLWYQDGNISEL